MESEAQCLLGDALLNQGKPAAAQAAFAEALAIRRQLSEQDPGNADCQRELAGVLSRVGGVLQRQGVLDAAAGGFRRVPRRQPAAGRAGPGQRRLAARACACPRPGGGRAKNS
jgi:tetratricopeptide (TPR) repeat protein